MKALFPILVALVCSVVSLSHAATYYVRTDGHDTRCGGLADAAYHERQKPGPCAFRTIQKAVDSVKGGDTIQVGNGIYHESVTASDKSGSPGMPIVIAARTRRQAAMLSIRLKGSSSYWEVRGFTFKGLPVGRNDCVRADGGHNRIIDNSIINCPYTAIRVSGAYNTVKGNYIERPQFGINFEVDSSHSEAAGNEVNRLKRWIDEDSDYMRIWGDGHKIRGNSFHGPHAWGDVAGAHVDCFQNWDGVGWGYLRNALFEDNYCSNAHQVCLFSLGTNYKSENVTFRNNVFELMQTGCNSGAIKNFKFYNNTEAFFRYGNSGINSDNSRGSTNGEIKNNIFYNSGRDGGANTYDIYGPPCSGTSAGNVNYGVGKTYDRPLYERDMNGKAPKFVNAAKDMRYAARNADGKYDGDSSHFEVKESEVSLFVPGEHIEYCPGHACDGILRAITGKSGSLIAFSPAVAKYETPLCDDDYFCHIAIRLWGDRTDLKSDYRLLADSPARNEGVNLSSCWAHPKDRNGVSRPLSGPWDAGAYQYVPVLKGQRQKGNR
jgi:hypothetical protein